MSYYVLIDGEQKGPFEDTTVAQMVGRGQIGPDTLVWTAGMADWERADSAPGLLELFHGEGLPPRRRAPRFGARAAPPPAAPTAPAGPVDRLDIGEAIATGLNAFWAQPGRAMVVALVYNLLPALLVLPLFALLFVVTGGEPEAMETRNPAQVAVAAVLGIALLALVTILYGGFCACMIDLVREEEVSVGKLFSGFARAGDLVVFGILYAVAVTVGFALLVVPGVFAAVAFMLTPYIIMESELSGLAAMRASFRAVMTLGWWRCFGLLVLLFAALIVLSLILEGLGLALGEFAHGVLQVVANILLTALAGVIFAAMYEQARPNSESTEA
jgi:hypothetical protein